VDEALLEGIALSLGGFFARANSFLHHFEAKAKEYQALADELALVKGQLANQAHRFFIQVAALKEALGVTLILVYILWQQVCIFRLNCYFCFRVLLIASNNNASVLNFVRYSE